MKRYMLALVLGVLLPWGSVADARIPDSSIAMGGISIGSTEAYVKATYGKPKTVSREYYAPRKAYIHEYNYGDSFYISILESTGTVFRMMSMDHHNNVSTPAGITIGSPLQDVLRAYGNPDLHQIDGEVDHYWYMGSGEKGNLVFHVSYGKVVGMACGKA